MPVREHIYKRWWNILAKPVMEGHHERNVMFNRRWEQLQNHWATHNINGIVGVVEDLKDAIAKLPPPMFTEAQYIAQLEREAANIQGKPLKVGFTWRVKNVTLMEEYDLGRAVARLDQHAQFQTAFEHMPHPHSKIDSHVSLRKPKNFCLSNVAHAVKHAITYGQLTAAVAMCNRQIQTYTPEGQHFPLGCDQCPACQQYRARWQKCLDPSDPKMPFNSPYTVRPITCAKCKREGCTRCFPNSSCRYCNGPCPRCGQRPIPNRGPICICEDAYANMWIEVAFEGRLADKRSYQLTLERYRRYGYYGDIYNLILNYRRLNDGAFATFHPIVLQRLAAAVPTS